MTPLFCELEELGRTATPEEPPTLDLDEFLDALSRLYDQVALPEKHVIMQEARAPPPAWTNMTFRPQLDPISEQLAQQNRGNLVDRLYTKKKEYELKVWLKQ